MGFQLHRSILIAYFESQNVYELIIYNPLALLRKYSSSKVK